MSETILLARHLFDPVADQVAAKLGPVVRVWLIERWLADCQTYHTVGSTGAATRISDASGPICGPRVALVLNRVRHVPVPMYENAAAVDRGYAISEATALFWSCLESLGCPILNSVAALKLLGQQEQPLGWAGAAARAGLKTPEFHLATTTRLGGMKAMQVIETPFQMSSSHRRGPGWFRSVGKSRTADLWIVGDKVLGNLATVCVENARRFARLQGIGFGALHFEEYQDESWRLIGFNALPLSTPPEVFGALLDLLGKYAQGRSMEDTTS